MMFPDNFVKMPLFGGDCYKLVKSLEKNPVLFQNQIPKVVWEQFGLCIKNGCNHPAAKQRQHLKSSNLTSVQFLTHTVCQMYWPAYALMALGQNSTCEAASSH